MLVGNQVNITVIAECTNVIKVATTTTTMINVKATPNKSMIERDHKFLMIFGLDF